MADQSVQQPSGLSLRAFVGVGFAIVAICLGLAFASAAVSLQMLSDRSEQLLSSGVTTTRLIEQLAERITEVERAARQYAVVGSPDLLLIYRERKQTLLQIVSELEDREGVSSLAPALQELRVVLDAIESTLGVPHIGTETSGRFDTMNSIAQRTRDLAGARFQSELMRLQKGVARLRTALIILTGGVIATALFGGIGFARLINRPLREISAGIDQLGRAELNAPIRVSGPRDLQAIGVSLDWLRHRVSELETQKSVFVRHMSHELKSPLANILAGVDLLKEDHSEEASRQEIAAIVERNATRLQRQIDDLLKYAGWQEANPPQKPVNISLQKLIKKIVTDLEPAAQAKNLTVRTCLESLTITGDKGQIHSMIENLIGNAIKYSPDNEVVGVRLKQSGGAAIIEVEDEGPGIPPELRTRVFEPFFRGPEATATSGTGIGLSLASAAANAHGGSIEILDKRCGAILQAKLPLPSAE